MRKTLVVTYRQMYLDYWAKRDLLLTPSTKSEEPSTSTKHQCIEARALLVAHGVIRSANPYAVAGRS